MANNMSTLFVLGIVALLVGGVLGAFLFPQTEVKTETKTQYVDRVVNQTVEVEVPTDYKQDVVDALLAEVSADKDLRKCGSVKYDVDEISVKKVYDGFNCYHFYCVLEIKQTALGLVSIASPSSQTLISFPNPG